MTCEVCRRRNESKKRYRLNMTAAQIARENAIAPRAPGAPQGWTCGPRSNVPARRGARMNDHACELCGWRGRREHREVNYSNALKLWVCARCFHSPMYDDALALQREPQRWL